MWEKACEVFKKNAASAKSKERTYNLCQQLIKCPVCGKNYVSHNDVYRCVRHMPQLKSEKCFCSNEVSFSMKRMDCMVVEATWLWYHDYVTQNGSKRLEEVESQLKELPEQIATLNSKNNSLSAKLEKIGEAYIDGLFTKKKKDDKIAEVKKDSADIDNQLNILQSRLSELKDEKTLLEMRQGRLTIDDTSKSLDNMSKKELYDLIHKHVSWVELKINPDDKNDREIIVHSKLFPDKTVKYKSTGIGQRYRLYYVSDDGILMDITKVDRYNIDYLKKFK